MKRVRQFLFRLRALLGRSRMEAELDDEIRIHLEMATEANVVLGMPRDQARLAAQRQFGGVEQAKESCRDEKVLLWVGQVAADVRFSARSLLRAPGFTATVLAIIALCVAANVVILSMLSSFVLRPLPFRESDRLVTVHNNYPKAGLLRLEVSVPHYLERKSGIKAFEESGAIRGDWAHVESGVTVEGVPAAKATPSFFRVLGAHAALGRTFTEDEGLPGKDQVIILGDGYWHEHFNGERSAIGKVVRIEGVPYTIVGVMPPGFHYLSYDSRFWRSLSFTEDERKDEMRHEDSSEMVARLRPGATIAEAQAQLDAVDQAARKLDPMAEMVRSVGYFSNVVGLQADHVSVARPVLLLLEAGVLFLLLIGIVNLANLLMVRSTGRAKEFSVRRALGAGNRQLVRALLIESLILSVSGGLLGVGLAAVALATWARIAAGHVVIDVTFDLDPLALVAALAISIILGVLLALPSIWLTLRGNPGTALVVESRGGTTSRPVQRLRHTLIVAQITLAFVLLAAAGLLGLSFAKVLSVPPGFQTENRVTGVVTLPWWDQYREPAKRKATVGRLLALLRAEPGVAAAAISGGVPFSNRTWVQAWSIVGGTPSSDEFIKEGLFTDTVSGGYFATLGIPLLEGRLLTDDDVQLDRKVCVVDEEFAHRHWPRGSALGNTIAEPYNPKPPKRDLYRIVGVVGSVKENDLADQAAHGAGYFPIQDPTEFMVTVRTAAPNGSAAASIRDAAARADPSLLVGDLLPMAARVEGSLWDRKTPLVLAAVFAGVSLTLAAIGIYGVLAYSVAQRRREIGIRMALGAQPSSILYQFLGVGLRLLALALPMGILGAWLAGRAIGGMLFGVEPLSPQVCSATAAVLVLTALPACLIPSRRAAQVAPNEALRAD